MGPSTLRARLTDQAATAVALARMVAGGAAVNAGHLLSGLVAESEGRAGHRLRERASAAALLVDRGGSVPAAGLDEVVAHAAAVARPRPVSTVDLLDAVIAVGGPDVSDLLESVGYHRDLDGYLRQDWWDEVAPETYGLGAERDMDADAQQAVARVRALSGGAVDLLLALTGGRGSFIGLDASELHVVRDRLERAGTGDGWDRGLDAVIDAARILADGAHVTTAHLLHATLVAGGTGPAGILEEARRDD